MILLTAREAEVLTLLLNGASNREAASALGISISMVKAHASRVYKKFNVPGRVQLLALHIKEPSAAPIPNQSDLNVVLPVGRQTNEPVLPVGRQTNEVDRV